MDNTKEKLKKIIESRRCGDSSCIWGRVGGMMTNGGCRMLKESNNDIRVELLRLARELMELVNE